MELLKESEVHYKKEYLMCKYQLYDIFNSAKKKYECNAISFTIFLFVDEKDEKRHETLSVTLFGKIAVIWM